MGTLPYVSKDYSCLDKDNFENYKDLKIDENSLCGIISIYIENNYFIKGPAYTWVNTAYPSTTDKTLFEDET